MENLNMNNQRFCQCCAMPLAENDPLMGTNADGTINSDYCVYCYKDGAFTADISMEEMIEACIPHMTSHDPKMTADAAREMMKSIFPTLKRWKKQ